MASTTDSLEVEPVEPTLPPLEMGDRLDQKTFHARYECMPEDFRAELIGGIVYMPSPLKPYHGRKHGKLMGWLSVYEESTPGVELYDNTTIILGPDSEPQPDALLLVPADKGGQTHVNEAGYLEGPPELICEVASSSEAYDLHSKKDDYERAGVQEYLVVVQRQAQVLWFVRRQGKYELLSPGSDGILRSGVFPGLWLDPAAFLRQETPRVMEVLRQGLASAEHAGWLALLAAK